jgi:MFS family permease
LNKTPNFFHLSLPFAIVNGVVWGIGIMVIPLLAQTIMKAGTSFAMLNLGIAVGAILWGMLSHKVKVKNLIFASNFLAFIGWGLIILFYHNFLVPLVFVFGFFAAGIFALASVVVTNTYDKSQWDKYISLMQAVMTIGTVVGLLITSVYTKAVVALPFLIIGFLSYLPIMHYHNHFAKHYTLHSSLLKPKMHFSEVFRGYFYHRFNVKHFLHLKNRQILTINLGWILALLSAAPIYAMYPLLMKNMFLIKESYSSLIYALSTALGALFFIVAGKISEKHTPFLSFNAGIVLYILSSALMLVAIFTSIHILGAAGFILMIIAWSFIAVGMNVGIVKLVDESKRAELLGVASTFQSLDNMAGGFLGGIIATKFGYTYVIMFSLMFAFFALIAGLALLKKDSIKGV